ncbi:MAG: permease-like cell division protein FtsX [bacterium]
MIFTNFKRITRGGFINFWRNGFLSFAAVIVITLSLTVFGGIIFISAFGHALINQVKDKVDINVYMTLAAPESDILSLQKTLQKLPEVSAVNYISSTTALTNFQTKWAGNDLILQGLNEIGYNPLPAVLNVKAKDPSQYAGIADFLSSNQALGKDGSTIVEKVNYNQNKLVIQRLSQIISAVNVAGSIIAIIFIFVAVIMIFNTIRLIVYNAKDEIGVMKLVGASNIYVRGPFVVSGIMYGVVSGVITLIILALIAHYSDVVIIKLAGIQGIDDFSVVVNILSTYFLANFSQIFSIIMGSGVVLGGISSYVAVRRYLKV